MSTQKTSSRWKVSALALTIFIALSTTSTATFARDGGFNGGDGGNLLGEVGNRINRTNLISIVKTYTRPRVVGLLNGISAAKEIFTENAADLEEKLANLPKAKDPNRLELEQQSAFIAALLSFHKKISSMNDFLALTEPLTVIIQPNGCNDNKGKARHGAFYTKSKKPYICLDETALLKRIDSSNAYAQVFALVAHEVAHFLGANETEAKAVQKLAAVSVVNQIKLGKYGVGTTLEDPLSTQLLAWTYIEYKFATACEAKLKGEAEATLFHEARYKFSEFSVEGVFLPTHEGRKGSRGGPSTYISLFSPEFQRSLMQEVYKKIKDLKFPHGETNIDQACTDIQWLLGSPFDKIREHQSNLEHSEFEIEGIPRDWREHKPGSS